MTLSYWERFKHASVDALIYWALVLSAVLLILSAGSIIVALTGRG